MNYLEPEEVRKRVILAAHERWKENPNDPKVKNMIEWVVGSIILEVLEKEGIKKYQKGDENGDV